MSVCLGGGDLIFLAFWTAGKGGGERHGLDAIEDDDGEGVVGKLGCGEREKQRRWCSCLSLSSYHPWMSFFVLSTEVSLRQLWFGEWKYGRE